MPGKIKLFVQARKDGYKVLYPTPTPPEFFKFAGDLRPESTTPYILGKSLYSLALSPDGCIFTKHLIVQDVQRQGLGNVSFSVLVPHTLKLSGNDMANLLDELAETYRSRYCPDFCLGNVREDWKILTDITDRYSLARNHAFDFKTAETDLNQMAFVYYSDREELRKYFGFPYQKEYAGFKQVFLADGRLKGKPENPINALTGLNVADLTGKIDLKPPLYKVKFKVVEQNDEKNVIRDFKLFLGNEMQQGDCLEFCGDEACKPRKITIASTGYETKTFDFCPAEDADTVYVQLQKARKKSGTGKQYRVVIDEKKGRYSAKGKAISCSVPHCPQEICDTRRGYKFTGWKLDYGRQGNFDGTYTAEFKELWWHKIPTKIRIAILCGIVLAAGITGVAVKSAGNGKKQPTDGQTENKSDKETAGNAANGDSLSSQQGHDKQAGRKDTGNLTRAEDAGLRADKNTYHVDGRENKDDCGGKPQHPDRAGGNATYAGKESPCLEIPKFENEFWKIVKSDDDKVKMKFDALFTEKTFGERGYEKITGCPEYKRYKKFYNRYLSREDDKNIGKGNYDFNKGFGNIKDRKRKAAKSLDELEELTKEALGLYKSSEQ